MKPEAQRIAIATWLLDQEQLTPVQNPPGTIGYRGIDLSGMWIMSGSKGRLSGCNHPTPEACRAAAITELVISHDWLGDLNAMALAEATLDRCDVDTRSMYWDYLMLDTGSVMADRFDICWRILRSTAAQRAEAFLRCLGLWVDEPEEKQPL